MMWPRRIFPVVVCFALVPGSLSVTIGYALHLRSNNYRRSVERSLTERLGMDVSIRSIRPLTFRDRALNDVRVQLQDNGDQVFSCASVLWRSSKPVSEPDLIRNANVVHDTRSSSSLELRDGWLLVGTAAWEPTQYQKMLAGGLGHDFAALGLKEVRANHFDLKFTHPGTAFTADDASGVILFDEYGEGHASFACLKLNGVRVEHPVSVVARFTPGERLIFHEVRLTVPSIPLASFGVDGLLGQASSSGEFEGSITYRQACDTKIVDITGALHDAELADFTTTVPGGPFHGTIDASLDSATFRDRKLQDFAIHGRVLNLRMGELLPGLVETEAQGLLDLEIDQMRWIGGRLIHLSTRGTCSDLSLEAVSRMWGQGQVTGTAELNIRSLLIVNDQLRLGDVEINAVPPKDGPGLIDRALIAQAVSQRFGVDIEAALPDHIEYTRFGARFVLEDGQLRVLGTHGRDGRTILTVKLFGQPLGIIRQPHEAFAVPDLLTMVRDRTADIDTVQIQAWWEQLKAAQEDQRP